MVYRSFRGRRYRRKRMMRRRKSSSWGSTAWNLAKKAATGVVKYYLNPEYKFKDYSASHNPSTATSPVYGDVSWIAAGTSETTRNGNTIKVTSMQARIVLNMNSSATATQIRIVFFSDISSNGVAPDWTDVFESTNSNTFLNKDYGRRFRILYDRVWIVDTDNPIKYVNIYRKLQHHIKYLNSNADDTALGQGAIYFAVTSSETTNTPRVDIATRLRYLDN